MAYFRPFISGRVIADYLIKKCGAKKLAIIGDVGDAYSEGLAEFVKRTADAFGERHVFDRSSAWWAFNFVSNWANLKYNYMIKDINAEQKRIEDALFSGQKSVEEKVAWRYAYKL